MGLGVSKGGCESACEGVPGARTVTAESGEPRYGEGEGMSVAVRTASLAVDDCDTWVVNVFKASFSWSVSAVCSRLAFLGLGLPFVSYRHVCGTHNRAHGE